MACSDATPAAIGALASALAQNLSDQELALLSAMLVQLADSLALILVARASGADG